MPTRNLDTLTNQLAQVSPTGAGTTPPNAYQQFNNQLLNLMKQYQSLGTAPAVRTQLNASDLQADRTSTTSPALIGAAPSVQSAARSASVQAVEPTIRGAQQGAQTYTEQLNAFGNLMGFARQVGADYQAQQERAQDRAFQQIMSMIDQYGGQAFQGIDQNEVKNLEKIAGLPTGFIARLGTLKTTQQQQLDQQNQITPYQQQQIDLEKQRLAQSQSQFDASLKQEQNSPAQTPDIILTDDGMYRYENGSLVPIPIKDQEQALASAQQTQQPSPSPASAAPTSGYTGPSIVDYLNSIGQPSDFNSRSRLAASLGITGYTGSAAQNTQMLNLLRGAR